MSKNNAIPPVRAAAAGDGAPAECGIYMASKAVHGPRWRDLRAAGWPIISTWIDEAEAGRTTDWADLWDRCAGEPARAAVTVLYAEEGEEMKGALAEVGAALSHGRKVIVVGPVSHTWTKHRNVSRALSLDEGMSRAMVEVDRARMSASRAGPSVGAVTLEGMAEALYFTSYKGMPPDEGEWKFFASCPPDAPFARPLAKIVAEHRTRAAAILTRLSDRAPPLTEKAAAAPPVTISDGLSEAARMEGTTHG